MEHSESAPLEESTTLANELVDALDAVLSCSRGVVELAVATFIAGGHLLLEDVPGVGKTTLARALGTAIGGDTRRIQFTPDMLPGDLTGVSVYNQRTGNFDFHPGPLFANIVIADEVNRANPKAQSAMLEAMGEGQVSADGRTWPLPDPFFVVATQNPIELEGTYPLPEAQLDRFMACTDFGYPTAEAECAMLTSPDSAQPLRSLHEICTVEQAQAMRAAVAQIMLSTPVARYIVDIVSATRAHTGIRYGASPRAGLHLAAMARAKALMAGRGFVIPDDVRAVAVPVLGHRLVLQDGGYGVAVMEHAKRLVTEILDQVAVPRAEQRTAIDGFVHRAR
ncbi:MAG: MoxR family ATPase [Bifidobacterium sp.]|uniref:AAA family ATPase n=1 Tax=Bifidobacterium sp. TaxID=41200 RepID=UPI00257FFDD1|nr:MoxR family ATPase [Bifidobacterium sp.]MBS5400655.1 MoxR family ATPase [Bifidobacterium sp.]